MVKIKGERLEGSEVRTSKVERRHHDDDDKSFNSHLSTFNSKNNYVKKLKAFISAVTMEFPMISSVILNIHPDKTNAVLGKTNITVYGKDTLTGEMCGNLFEISPPAFFQINKEQAETIYDQALEYAGLDGTQTVLDLYCGIGTITLHLAKKAKKALEKSRTSSSVLDATNLSQRIVSPF